MSLKVIGFDEPNLDEALRLSDEAGRYMSHGLYELAADVYISASLFATTPSGAQALKDNAWEALTMALYTPVRES